MEFHNECASLKLRSLTRAVTKRASTVISFVLDYWTKRYELMRNSREAGVKLLFSPQRKLLHEERFNKSRVLIAQTRNYRRKQKWLKCITVEPR